VTSTSEAIEIRVSLNLPMRYLNHAPRGGGDFVEIQLRPVSTREAKELQQRQSLPWKSSADVPLVDVVYEGNFPGTPTLALNFSRPVSFEVTGGRDFRSIIVSIPIEPATSEDRSPAPGTEAAATPLPAPGAASRESSTIESDSPTARTGAATGPETPRPGTPAEVTPVDPETLPFTINLYSVVEPIDLAKVPRLPAFDGHRLYTTQATVGGNNWHRLRLGFFADADSAKKVIEFLKGSYPDAWVARASRQERVEHAGSQAVPSAPAAPVAAAAAAGVSRPQPPAAPPQPAKKAIGRTLGEEEQAALMDEAHTAMTAGNYQRAVQIYTKILLSPPGKFSQEAQELLGLARERNGQIAHAKAEYQEYLRLYPDGPGAERVQQRLAGLLTASRLPQERLRPMSATQTGYDFRAQFTGGYDWDFLDSSDSESRVSELYLDGLLRGPGLSARLGRQTRSSGGVLGRFDGALLGHEIVPSLVGNVVLGFPVARTSETSVETEKYFYGLSFDLGTFWDHWDFQTYIIEQKSDDLVDRRAVGGELRYFDAQRSFFSLVDYDIYFNELNTILGVGTWTFESGTTINANLDYRNSPVLTLSNALIGQPVSTLEELRTLFTDDEIEQLALDRTAESTTGTLGVTHPFSPRFQVSGDVTVTKLSSTPASGGVPATPGTGYEFLYNLQFTGTSLVKTGDLGIVGLRYSDLDTSDLYTISLNTRYPFTRDFRINPRFDVIYRKNKNDSGERMTYRPFLRLEYQWNRSIRFESEIGGDWIEDDGPLGSETTRTYFVNLGYRVDF
jgi:tetratricopeptide (TPR) repeat protein